MPISDEIIELEPVKKSRTKLIILFVIIGVLAAAAVAFLVLYLLKPSVEASNGRVNQIEPETSSLCLSSDADGNKSLFAAVGNEYTVYARVSAEGDASTGVVWSMEPVNSLIKVASGVDPEDPTRCFYTFKPDDKFAGQHIILTARSEADIDQVTTIEFDIKKQGTEVIDLKLWWRGTSTTRHEIDGSALNLPYYNDITKNLTYTVSFEQLGAYDAVAGKNIDNITKEEKDGVWSNKLDVTSSDPSVLTIGTVSENNANPPRFTFTLKKSSDTPVTITITANAHNDFADPISKTIVVNAKRSADMDIIEEIFFSTNAVDEAFFSANMSTPLTVLRNNPNLKANEFTIPYSGRYDNIADHLVLYPLSIQYDSKSGELKTEWRKWIKSGELAFAASSAKLNVSLANDVVSLRAADVSDGSDCILTITDKSDNSVGGKVDVKMHIVARNQTVVSSLRLPGAALDTPQADISAEWTKYDGGDTNAGFSVAHGADVTFSVTYTINAPDATNVNSFLTNKYLSTGFKFQFDSDDLTIVKGNTYSASNKDKIIVSDKEDTLDNPFVTVRKTGQNLFTAVATFTVHINEEPDNIVIPVTKNQYTFKFTKIGLSNSHLSSYDPTWETNVVLHIEDVADKAGFKYKNAAWNDSDKDHVEWNKIRADLFNNSSSYEVGSFKIDSAPTKGTDNIWRGTASFTVQNQRSGVDFPFDFRKLVSQEDTGPILVKATNPDTTAFTRTGTEGNHSIRFKGVNPDNFENDVQQEITLTVRNIGGETIAIFTVNVYVIDPIKTLVCEDVSIREIKYDAEHLITVDADVVEFYNYLNQSPDVYSTDKIGLNVRMFYIDNGGEVELETGLVNNIRTFSYKFSSTETIKLFEFNGVNIKQCVDFFEYLYNQHKGQTFVQGTSKFAIEYCINEGDTYVGMPAARRIMQYVRQADRIGVFKDEKCTTLINTDVYDETPNKEISFSLNSGGSSEFYIAPIFDINDKTDGDIHFVAPQWNDKTHYSKHEDVYITVRDVPDGFTIDEAGSRARDAAKNQYFYVRFTAKTLNPTEQEFNSTWSLAGTYFGGYKINVSVQNRTRAASAVELFDENGKKLDLNSSDAAQKFVNFGRTTEVKDLSLYSKTVTVKVTYGAITNNNTYNRFEPVIVGFPTPGGKARFRVSVDGQNEVRGERVKIVKTDESDITDINDKNAVVKEFELVISCVQSDDSDLNVYATERITAADKQYLSARAELTAGVNTSVGVIVSTGVKQVQYHIEKDSNSVTAETLKGSTVDISEINTCARNKITFNLKNPNDNPMVTLSVIGTTFGDEDGYEGLQYNEDKISGSAKVNGGIATNSGLSISVDIVHGNVNITLEQNNVKVLKDVTVDIIFTGRLTGREIVIPLKIDVTMDIYQLDLTGGILSEGNSFATTGKSGDLTFNGDKPKLNVTFNETKNQYAPSDVARGRVETELVVKNSDGKFVTTADMTAEMINESDNTITLNIPNSLLKDVDADGREYWVRVAYTPLYGETRGTTVYSAYKRIRFKTSAQGVRLKSSGNVTVTDGGASVDVLSGSDKFNFVAEAYNLGTLEAESVATGKTISYKLYTDDDCNTESDVATVSNGVVSFVKPDSSGKGTVYLKVDYEDGNGNSPSFVVAISYTVAIARADAKDGLSNNITLYMNGDSHTYISDITKHFDFVTNFANVNTQPLNFELKGGASDYYRVDGYSVIPVRPGNSGGSLTLEITDGTVINGVATKITKEFGVSVVNLNADNALTLSSNSASINIADESANSNSASFTATVKGYTILDAQYSVSTDTNKVIVPTTVAADAPVNVSFDKSKFTSADNYEQPYIVKANASYTVKSSSSAYSVSSDDNNTIVVSKNFTLTASGSYKPTFRLLLGSNVITTENTVDISNITDHIKVEVTNKKTASESNFSYVAESQSSVVRKVAGTNDEFEFVANKAGAVDFIVKATCYGKEYASDRVTYTFVYGGSASQSIAMSVNDGAYAVLANTDDPIYIDFNDKAGTVNPYAPTKIKYTIDTSDVGGTIAESSVHIDYVGNNVTSSDIVFVKDGSDNVTSAYREFTVLKATKLIISGSVRANGTTYYLSGYDLSFVAHDPIFELDGDDEIAISSGNYANAELEVNQSDADFKGDYTVEYSLVGNSVNYATVTKDIDGKGIVTVKGNIVLTTDTAITVRATVTVSGGAHKGAVYTVDRLVTIKGVALPEVNWKYSTVTVENGNSIDFTDGGYVLFDGDVDGYTYENRAYKYDIVSDNGLTKDTDYTFNSTSGELTINSTANTKAGGLITVRVTATLADNINNGATVRSGLMDVVIKPTIEANSNNVPYLFGGVGSHDISNAISLNARTDVDGNFVKNTDTFIVKVLSGNAVGGINYNDGKINIIEAQTTNSTLSLTATVVMTSGAYMGATFEVPVTVHVLGATLTSGVTATWNSTDGKYNAISAASLIGTLESGVAVKNIKVRDNTFLTVDNNNTASPVINVNGDANMVGGLYQNNTLDVVLEVTLNNDHVYYVSGSIAVAQTTAQFTVTFDANGGTISGDTTKTVGYNTAFSSSWVNTPTYTDGDYAFAGWYTLSVGGAELDGSKLITSDITAYAHWTPKTYTNGVTLNYNDGTTANRTITVTYGSTYGDVLADPTSRTGYDFVGWYTSDNKLVTKNTIVTSAANGQTLTAHWNAKSYNVTVVDGGNEYTMTATFGQTFAQCGLNQLVKTGYAFDGWYTENTYTNKVELTDTVGDLPSGYKLYAKWTAKGFTVTLVDDQNVATSNTITVTFGKTFAQGGLVTLTKTGYTFDGWYTENTFANKVNPTDTVTTELADGYTLYAKWTAKTFAVTLVDAQNVVASNSITVTFGETFAQGGLVTLTKTGYTFGGWFTDNTYTNEIVSTATVGELTSGYTLYAKWTADTYTVTLNSNFGDAPATSTISVTFGQIYGNALIDPAARIGYTFDGWYTESTFENKVEQSDTVTTAADGQTLYAKWTAVTVTVIYSENYSGGETTIATLTFGEAYELPTEPTREGYNFLGWFTDSVNGDEVDGSDTVDNVNAHILYAHWEEIASLED